jgi:tRNA(Ile)-lysidine synthase
VRASERQVGAVARLAAGRCPSAAVDLARGVRVRRRYGDLVLERGEAARVAPWGAVEIDIPGAIDLPNGWCLRSRWIEGDDAGLAGGAAADPTSAAGEAADGLSVAVSPQRVSLPLRARPPRPGDRIRLAQGRRKLSDVLVDARIPRPLRSRLVVVAGADDMVVWIPGVVASPWVGAREPGERQMCLRAIPPGAEDDRRCFPRPSRRIGIAGPDRPW